MDLTTTYMGLRLKTPLIVASCDITDNAENVKKCADCGAGAVVLKSLFEEQLMAAGRGFDGGAFAAEAADYVAAYSKAHDFGQYLDMLELSRKSSGVPVIASIHCVSAGEWVDMAKKIETAGADGLELNISIMPFTTTMTGEEIEARYFDIVQAVIDTVKLPVAVKTGPYFSNPYLMLERLSFTGIRGLVVFNRLYRPDVDIDKLALTNANFYSQAGEHTAVLRWLSLLSGNVKCDLSAATGFHSGEAVIKALLCGAATVQVCSTLYKNGMDYLSVLVSDIEKWMKNFNYQSIDDFRGRIRQDAAAMTPFERVQFMKRAAGELAIE